MHGEPGLHGVSWPPNLEKAEKLCLRRKLLPLARPAERVALSDAQRLPAVELDVDGERADGARTFWPPQRPARPPTAERTRVLAVVSFPARLQLRGPGEAPGPPGPFSAPGNLVLTLDTQDAVRELVSACAQGKAEIMDGTCLTAWTAAQPPELEPLTARRIERTLAVEPIELVAERQGGEGSSAQVLRYGEGFRLRAAGTRGLYLGHEGVGTCWKSAQDLAPPRGTRFAAHGGELGAPLQFGRPVSLRRVPSPPPSEADSDLEYSDDEAGSPSTQEKLVGEEPKSTSSSPLLPESAGYVKEALYSRAADKADEAVTVTFLPLSLD